MNKILIVSCYLLLSFNCIEYSLGGESKFDKSHLLDSTALIDSNNAFAFIFYDKLRQDKDNFVFSPYNIYSNLALLSQGASGETLLQFIRFLHFPLDQEISSLFFSINKSLFSDNKDSQPIFLYYNNLWIQKNFQLKEQYLLNIENDYKTIVNNVDFINNQKEVTKKINEEIKRQTKGKIINLFEPNSIESHTKAIITSVLYFKGLWERKFDSLKTELAPFYTEDRATVEHQMMNNKDMYGFTENLSYSLLEIPYQTSDLEREFSLFIFLPKDKEGLKEFEDSFSLSFFLDAKNTIQSKEVTVSIPKFNEQKRLNLATLLKSLGLRIPFTPFADFSKMTGNRDLYVNQLITQTSFEINEEGTEAAAVSGGSFVPTSVTLNEIFKADHPFVYLIVEKKSQLILFMGRFIK